MKDLEWLEKTWNQVSKDFQLSGLQPPARLSEMSKEALAENLETKLAEISSNRQVFQQLQYRIDLPTQIKWEEHSFSELSELVLMRSFQKVWLRKYFSN